MMVKIRMQQEDRDCAEYYDLLPDEEDNEHDGEQEEQGEEEQELREEEEQQQNDSDAEEDAAAAARQEEIRRLDHQENRQRTVRAQWPMVGGERSTEIREALEESFEQSQERWDELYNSANHYRLRFAIVDIMKV
ncbi:unknown protein [Seminavis robusta]|uniref:Uncharacterized protein n=1 Tax=Seminavis robusta TaxID=568900 RepID=A0A9N8F349_9STRA|nr:unknown protein [Seminavis robusta]|eukprot:Sro4035_g352620.1 n/a (135) ;mRNA; r:2912-3316